MDKVSIQTYFDMVSLDTVHVILPFTLVSWETTLQMKFMDQSCFLEANSSSSSQETS
jgi:hypothetical protein